VITRSDSVDREAILAQAARTLDFTRHVAVKTLLILHALADLYAR